MTRPGTAKPPRVGLVGLGYWGPNLLRVLVDSGAVDVAWICDLDQSRLGQFARRYPAIGATERYDDLLEDPDLDAVLIATPVFTHFDLATRSLEAGKHSFVEKPLATSSSDASALLDLAESKGLALACGHTFVHSPPVQEVKRLLERDELGEIYFISSSRVNLGLHQSDVSVIWDLGPHDFSILRHWIPELPATISAVGRDSIVEGIPDIAFVTMRYASGTVANLEMSWLAPSKLRRTVIVGSEKMVVYTDGDAEPVRVFDQGVVYRDPESFGEYQLSYRTGDIVSPKVDTAEPLVLQLEAFVRAIEAGATPPDHADLCRDVVVLAQAAEASLENGGAPVAVEGDRAVQPIP